VKAHGRIREHCRRRWDWNTACSERVGRRSRCGAVALYRRVDVSQFPNQQVFDMTLTKRLEIIRTGAANAPYLGLLGTVLGLMLSFQTMGASGTMAVSRIMIGLNLALTATTVGRLVASSCVAMNNVLHRRVNELVTLIRSGVDRDLDQINVIPLVDGMLVLLVIVLTTSACIMTRQIPVDLANTKEAGDRRDGPLVITIFLNDQPVTNNGLKIVLNPHPRESFVVVRADRVTALKPFIGLVDEVQGRGFRQVSLDVVRS